MKKLETLYKELGSRKDFAVISAGFHGGAGQFIKGAMADMTVIWSYTGGWEHVSIDGRKRTPTWEEMCELKDMFFEKDECCVQYHQAEKDYVNNLPYCLHIWKPIAKYSGELPIPPNLFVGLKDAGELK